MIPVPGGSLRRLEEFCQSSRTPSFESPQSPRPWRYIRKGMFVEVGRSEISPSFDNLLKMLYWKGEHLAFVPDTNATSFMLNVLSCSSHFSSISFLNCKCLV